MTIAVGAVLVVAFAATYLAVYQGTGDALRGQIDRELRAAADAFATELTHVPSAELTLAGRDYIATQPFRASSRVLFLRTATGATLTNQPELLGLAHPDNDETAAEQAAENELARRIITAPAGFSSLDDPDTGSSSVSDPGIPCPLLLPPAGLACTYPAGTVCVYVGGGIPCHAAECDGTGHWQSTQDGC